jgi:hypothetical protein
LLRLILSRRGAARRGARPPQQRRRPLQGPRPTRLTSKRPLSPPYHNSINGDFVGGCDILTQMNSNGELAALLAAKKQ